MSFLRCDCSKRPCSTILLTYLQIQALNKGLGQELQENSGIGRSPGDRVFNTKKVLLEAFFGRLWGGDPERPPRASQKASKGLPAKEAWSTILLPLLPPPMPNKGPENLRDTRFLRHFRHLQCHTEAQKTLETHVFYDIFATSKATMSPRKP